MLTGPTELARAEDMAQLHRPSLAFRIDVMWQWLLKNKREYHGGKPTLYTSTPSPPNLPPHVERGKKLECMDGETLICCRYARVGEGYHRNVRARLVALPKPYNPGSRDTMPLGCPFSMPPQHVE